MARSRTSFVAALGVCSALGGCGMGPRYPYRVPASFEPTRCVVGEKEVAVFSDGSWGYTSNLPKGGEYLAKGEETRSLEVSTTGSVKTSHSVTLTTYPDFGANPSLLAPKSETPAGGSRRLGDLRTVNRIVSARDYDLLVCGWAQASSASDDCRSESQDIVDGLLAELRVEAARVGADLVQGARCFGRNAGSSLLVWCEGIAYLSAARAQQACAVAAAR